MSVNVAEIVQQFEQDAKTAEEAVGKKKIVTPRTGDSFKSLPMIAEEAEQQAASAIQALNFEAELAVEDVINHNMTRGFATETVLKAWKPNFDGARAKADDTKKIWRWELSTASWVDTGLSDKDQAISYTNNELNKIAETQSSRNIYDKSEAVLGSRLNGVGAISVVDNSKMTGFIPVVSGETYTLSWSNSDATAAIPHAFFTSKSEIQGINYSAINNSTKKYTFTVPANVSFMILNLKQNDTTIERQNVQIERGSVATDYVEFGFTYKLNEDVVPSSIVKKTELDAALSQKIEASDVPNLVEPLLEKDYEIVVESKNLFNEDDIQNDKFLSTVNGGISSSAGWKISGFIPVIEDQKYTLSGQRARQGISFFTTKEIDGSAALLYDNTSTLPLTVTAPVGAKYAVIALESATVKGWSDLQFELGDVATEYKPYGYKEQLLDKSKIDGLDAELSNFSQSIQNIEQQVQNFDVKKKASVNLINGKGFAKSGDLEIGLAVFNTVNYDTSAVFNFYEDKHNSQLIRRNGDDAAPVRMMSATIGANHGYSRTVLTAASHGKTNADVGSIWSNGTYEWVIIQIISDNQLAITCRTANIALSTGNTLTHVSGATNTANIVPTAVSAKQWYPMLKNHKVNLSLDNQINNDANIDTGFNDSLKISESYDLMEKSDIVEWLILNGGKEFKSYNAASACNVSHTHTFNTDLIDVISANFFVYKDLSAANDLMFTQSAPLEPVNNELLYYVPRSVAFTHESVAYDFSKLQNVADLNITNRIEFTSERTESNAVLPDRLIMLAGNIGYASGYLPVLDAAPSVRNTLTSKGLQISQAKDASGRPSPKLYPYLVDGLTTLQAGANYSCVAYRAYFERPSIAARTVQYDVPHGNEAYLFLDWHSGDFVDVVELKPYLQGRSFEVIEKTENVELLTKVASSNIAVRIGIVTGNARLILKFK